MTPHKKIFFGTLQRNELRNIFRRASENITLDTQDGRKPFKLLLKNDNILTNKTIADLVGRRVCVAADPLGKNSLLIADTDDIVPIRPHLPPPAPKG